MRTLILAAALAAGGLTLAMPTDVEARPRVIDHRRLNSPPRPQPPRHSPPRPGYRYGGHVQPLAQTPHPYFLGRLVRRAAPAVRTVPRVAAPILRR